jgi:hypothetical protein
MALLERPNSCPHGAKNIMRGGEPVQFESSVRPIVQYARHKGYEELATQLSEI